MEGALVIRKSMTAIFILFMASILVNGQELVFEEKVDSIIDSGAFGPNKRHFFHLIAGTEIIIPESKGTFIKTGFPLSTGLTFGFRYKLKLARPVSLVAESGYNRLAYRLAQLEGKSFPDTLLHKMQSVRLNHLFGGFAIRIRFGQKGNYLGNYLDLGIRGTWNIGSRVVEKDNPEPGNGLWFVGKKVIYSGLDIIEPLTSQAILRLGFDRTSVIVGYRLDRALKENSVVDMPRLTVGLEFAPIGY